MPGSTAEPVSTSLDSFFTFFVDLAPTFLGAFLGFLFALLANGLIHNGQKKRSVNNLADELSDFLHALHDVFLSDFDPDVGPMNAACRESLAASALALAHRIHLPIWHALVATGDLLALMKQDYFESLVRAYVLILELRSRVNAYALVAHSAQSLPQDDALIAIHQAQSEIIALAHRDAPLRHLLHPAGS
jgi:hypothetical protein